MNCPYCAEEIKDEALKCKHCGEWLPRDSYFYPADKNESNFDDIFVFKIEGIKIRIQRLTSGKILIYKNGKRVKEIFGKERNNENRIIVENHVVTVRYKNLPFPFGLLTWNSGFQISINGIPLEKSSSDPIQAIQLAKYALLVFALKELVSVFIYNDLGERYFAFFLFMVLLFMWLVIKKIPSFCTFLGSVYGIIEVILFMINSFKTEYIENSMGGFIFWLFIRAGATLVLIQGFISILKLKSLEKKFSKRPRMYKSLF